MFDVDETIVAISSAAGAAGRSIVRLSGERAGELAGRVFEPSLAGTGGFRAVDGTIRVEGLWPVTSPARVYVFRAPRSYTRQDVIELHVPGQTVASVVREALIAAGARPAEAGEFTARAFLSGRLDLARAEAVADIIDAEADAQLRSAVGVLEGSLARLCRPAAETLTEALALVESSIDFADEDIELCPPGELSARLAGAAETLASAAASSGRWTAADAQPRVAIAGLPNAGKSSLLNALSGLDRAIVSALAGTTRDVLSAPGRLAGGQEVLLLDAAGLGAGDDPMSEAAHAAAREATASAEAVLFVFDATEADTAAAEELLSEVGRLNRRARPIVVANKIDLLDTPPLPRQGNANPPLPRGAIDESALGRDVNSPRRKAGVWGDGAAYRPPQDADPSLPQETNPPLPRGAIDESALGRDVNSPRRKAGVGDTQDNPTLPGETAPLLPGGAMEQLHKRFGEVLGVSATRGDGLEELRRRLAEHLARLSPPRADGLLLHDRQRRAIDQAVASAGRAASLLAAARTLADVAELAAVELRLALESLKELTGEVVTEDILSTIFARFCVGK